MRDDWIENAWDIGGGMRLVEEGSRGDYYMWFAYKGVPYFYVSYRDRVYRKPNNVVHDVEILDYARALWELGK